MQILGDLIVASGADLAMTFGLRVWDEATWVTGLVGEGDPWAFRHFEELDDQPIHQPDWLDPEVPGSARERFVDLRTLRRQKPLHPEHPLHLAYLAAGVTDQLRLLIYDRDTFVAWVGVLKRGGRFERDVVDRLTGMIPDLHERCVEARQQELREESALPVGAIAHVRDGIRAMSSHAQQVLSRPLCEALGRVARQFHRSGEIRRETLVAGLHVQMSRLTDPDTDRVMLWMDRLPSPTIHPLEQLAPRVREAVLFTANGATAREAADAMQVTENTVRGYLKEAYRQLGVANRVELAARLNGIADTDDQ